jgi:hypothetical protein
MLYVVVIEKEDAKKDYKVYTKSADAIRRHRTASYHMASSEPARIGGEEMCIVSCSMFRQQPMIFGRPFAWLIQAPPNN